MPADTSQPMARHAIKPLRHTLVRRELTVREVASITPRMRRITFESPELASFVSASFDDHIKLFFPGEEDEPVMRDFTPRAFDTEQRTLQVDFALHDAGPATRWAANASIGDKLAIGGPRGSRVVPDDFDWYLMLGDESALPAMGRWVESLRPGVSVNTVVCIASASERQTFDTRADWSATWVERGEPSSADGARMLAALARFVPPPGDGFVWIAGEASMARALRGHFMACGHPRAWLRASGYWKLGERAAHVELDE